MRSCLIFALPLLGLSLVRLADYRTNDPNEACALLSNAGLGAGRYRNMGDGVHRCSSRRRAPPLGGAVKHSIRFAATGDARQVRQLRLTLAVNTASEQQPAHCRLRDHANTLTQHALQAPLTPTGREPMPTPCRRRGGLDC